MFAITENFGPVVGQVERGEITPDKIVLIEEHPQYAGELRCEPMAARDQFYSRYHDWLSRYMVLSELFNLGAFIHQLYRDGYEPLFGRSCEDILTDMMRWTEPLKIEGYDLHPFQQFSLRRALEQEYWFFNWSTGAGKSFCSAAGAKELFDRNEIDVVIACTVSKSKLDLCRFFEHAGLDAVVNDGAKVKRRKGYAQRHQVYVANYEKLWVDYDELEELVTGTRTLWVFDECHKVVYSPLNNGTPNKARRAFHRLSRLCRPRVWPMSASVVNGNPLRFRDVFGLADPHHNPLDPTSADFLARYADEVKTIDIETKTGRTFPLTVVDWNLNRLTEVRHRVGAYTQAVRKTDPGVREYFKGMATIVEPVQMSSHERQIADAITDKAWHLWCDRGVHSVNLGPYYAALRYLCNTPRALLATEHEVGQEIAAEVADLIAKAESTKLAKLNEQLESIRESGDKVAVFTHWTNLTLHLIKDKIEVPHVVHFGVGQSDKDSQAAKEQFLTDPDITCFLSSDAGSHGLNLQCARYVIQYEPTYSYDDGMQRASRIDRADSHLDGLTNYIYVTEDSVEERVWAINNDRRIISGVVQGTEEVLSYGDRARAGRSETQNMSWLIFGDRI